MMRHVNCRHITPREGFAPVRRAMDLQSYETISRTALRSSAA